MLRSKTHWFDYYLIIQVTLIAQAGGTELNEAMNNALQWTKIPINFLHLHFCKQILHLLPKTYGVGGEVICVKCVCVHMHAHAWVTSSQVCSFYFYLFIYLFLGLFFLVSSCLMHHLLTPLHLIYKDSKLLVNDVFSKRNRLKYIFKTLQFQHPKK